MTRVFIETDSSTLSAVSAMDPSREGRVLGILWVFPERCFTPLTGSSVSFGRAQDCNVRLQGARVSRLHATAERRGSHWVLVDHGSKNGVLVNRERTPEALLAAQHVVRIGDFVGVVVDVEARQIAEGVATRELAPGIYGGPTLAAAFRALTQAAVSDINVVLIGQTGTGKEVFARALHASSGRSGELVSVNCAALPAHLAEAELFGYRKGAFTGAERDHRGYVLAADGGTLFLDEVLDLDRGVQAKLLRVLEERAVVRLGETRAHSVDLRVVTATQASLHDAVERGMFRADLMARLSGLDVVIPPLSERREDVIDLFQATLRAAAGKPPALGADLVERLCNYDWPLNVREVVQVARRSAVLHGNEPVLTALHLPPRIEAFTRGQRLRVTPGVVPSGFDGSVEGRSPGEHSPGRTERRRSRLNDRDARDVELLVGLLRECSGNVKEAAKRMGISRQRAYRLIEHRPEVDLDALRHSGTEEPG